MSQNPWDDSHSNGTDGVGLLAFQSLAGLGGINTVSTQLLKYDTRVPGRPRSGTQLFPSLSSLISQHFWTIMERLLRPGNSSQESQVRLLPTADLGNSRDPPEHGRGAPLKDNRERLELDDFSLKPQGEPGPSASLQYLPDYAASIHRRTSWWSWHSAWSMYAFLLLGIAFATGHHFYYASLHGKPAREQTQRLRYGTFLAFLTKACLIWAVVAALRQRIWATLRSKSLPPQGVDSLFAIADDPLAVLDWRTTMNGKTAVLMAAIAW